MHKMSRKSKLVLILFVILLGGFVLMGMYAFVPSAKAGMDYYLGPTAQNVSNGLSASWQGITTSQGWITYVTPNLLLIGIVGGVFLTAFILLPIKDAWTGFWAGRHKVTVPSPAGAPLGVRTSTPSGGTTRPAVQEVVVETPKVEQSQEEPKAEE